MATLQEILGWFMSGSGRVVAGALLFLVMWGVKSLPIVKVWLKKDSGWLTSKRKKLATNTLLAMGPTALALTNESTPPREVLTTALEAALVAMGLQGGLKAALSAPVPGNKKDE